MISMTFDYFLLYITLKDYHITDGLPKNVYLVSGSLDADDQLRQMQLTIEAVFEYRESLRNIPCS